MRTKLTLSAGDASRGATLYARVCEHCHNISAGAPHKFGPTLSNVLGTRAGSIEGSKPSAGMRRVGEEGCVWDEGTLDKYLADCKGFVPGTHKPFAGVKSAQDRSDIIAYLREVSK